jgi:sulfoxide reductase heme-binding subunit YedZ
MPNRAIPYLKAAVHFLCLLPFFFLLRSYQNGALALQSDPVNYITHFTGDWALWILLADLAITPVRRLHASLAWLIRFRRMVGLYAFFYATLHLLTYVLLFSGYDVPTAIAGLRAGHLMEPWVQLKAIWPVMLDDVKKRRFIQAGLVTWVILLVLAATSPQRVLRWLGGKTWQRIHYLVYVAGFVALVHFWWMLKPGSLRAANVTLVFWALMLARVAYWGWKKFRGAMAKRRAAQLSA